MSMDEAAGTPVSIALLVYLQGMSLFSKEFTVMHESSLALFWSVTRRVSVMQ